MIWPWFERFSSLKSLTNNTLDKARFPKLTKWTAKMLTVKAVKETLANPEQMVEFYKTSLTNQEPDYDIGLPKPEPVEGAEAEEKPAE